MSQPQSNYIAQTLQLPQQIPLFRYNVNFAGLKKLLQQLNIQTNTNSQSIQKILTQLKSKHTTQQFKAHQKLLNNSIKFGINLQQYFDKQQNKFMQIKIDPKEQKTPSQEFGYKLGKLHQVVDYLLMRSNEHEERISADDKKHQQLIGQSFKRLEDKIDSSLATFSKTINNYFTQSNKKSAGIQSEFSILKLQQNNKLKQMTDQLNNKISQNTMDSSLQAFKHKLMKQMQAQITADQMKRMAVLQDYSNQLKNLQKNLQLENKNTKQKVNQMDQKVKNALSTKVFEMEKHKIYEKLSQFKNKSDELSRKNGEFVEFRKTYLGEKEKMKQQIIGLQDQIKKLNSKQSSFKKMQNVSDILQRLDPHLICQIGNQVKLHQKQIGKLQKKLMDLQVLAKQKTKGLANQIPQVNSGQNSELIQKILKQYLSNMDFQGRVKKVQRDLYETSKRADTFHELQKKIYNLSKDLDVGAIMKELKKKCDEEITKKELKIVDTKVESLFDYFKTMRRELQVIYKRMAFSSVKDSPDNPSLTSKKLIGANCLSCTPSTTTKRRTYSRQKLDFSMDDSHDYLKSTTYNKFK